MRDRIASRIADLLPARVVYFATIRLIAFATGGRYGATLVPDLAAMEAVQRWGKDHGMPGHGK